MSAVKIARAKKIASVGQFPRTWAAIIAAMPAELLAQCTGKQIAAIADAMRTQHDIGHSAGYDEMEAA